MKIIEPSATIDDAPNYVRTLLKVERYARKAYKSEMMGGTPETAATIIRRCIDSQHESVIEHATVSVDFTVDRGVSHELVRHRLASFTQESTRYCNYSKGKFGSEITVIRPCFWDADSPVYGGWLSAMEMAERTYLGLLACGASPQEARSVLPNSLKTELVMTTNIREWRHVFKLRCDKTAHPQMREVMRPLLSQFKAAMPVFFQDINFPLTWSE